MRGLKTDDMYLLSEILDKMDADIKIESGDSGEQGAKLIYSLARKAYKAKDEINLLIANVTGKTVEEVAELPAKEALAVFGEILKADGVADFF